MNETTHPHVSGGRAAFVACAGLSGAAAVGLGGLTALFWGDGPGWRTGDLEALLAAAILWALLALLCAVLALASARAWSETARWTVAALLACLFVGGAGVGLRACAIFYYGAALCALVWLAFALVAGASFGWAVLRVLRPARRAR